MPLFKSQQHIPEHTHVHTHIKAHLRPWISWISCINDENEPRKSIFTRIDFIEKAKQDKCAEINFSTHENISRIQLCRLPFDSIYKLTYVDDKSKKQTTKRDSQLRGSGGIAIFIEKEISIECLLIDFQWNLSFLHKHIYFLLECNARHKAMCT